MKMNINKVVAGMANSSMFSVYTTHMNPGEYVPGLPNKEMSVLIEECASCGCVLRIWERLEGNMVDYDRPLYTCPRSQHNAFHDNWLKYGE